MMVKNKSVKTCKKKSEQNFLIAMSPQIHQSCLKILCLPGYLQNGSTFAAKSSGIRKILTKKLDCQLDYVDPYHSIESWREFSFPIAANEEESDKTWASIVEKGNNVRWFEHKAPGVNLGLDESVNYLVDYIKQNGPYDGIIGFSQGQPWRR